LNSPLFQDKPLTSGEGAQKEGDNRKWQVQFDAELISLRTCFTGNQQRLIFALPLFSPHPYGNYNSNWHSLGRIPCDLG
jgi:hypothetical protein